MILHGVVFNLMLYLVAVVAWIGPERGRLKVVGRLGEGLVAHKVSHSVDDRLGLDNFIFLDDAALQRILFQY